MRLNIVHSKELDSWIEQRHYLKSVPAGAVIRMEFLNDTGNQIGAMLWGRNPSPKQDQRTQLCLTRMCFVDDTDHCVESQALAMARKHIRKHHNDIKGLVAYSSTGEGHEGIIYKADGWFTVSITRDKSRDCRMGRQNIDISSKIKWVRSP
jgi:hypothetical protein